MNNKSETSCHKKVHLTASSPQKTANPLILGSSSKAKDSFMGTFAHKDDRKSRQSDE
jgi:hypothetical protein